MALPTDIQPPPGSPPARPATDEERRRVLLVGALWCAAILTGVAWLLEYDHQDAGSSPAPLHWPLTSALPRPDGKPRLLLFLHPKCPCSRATVAELETIVARTRGGMTVTVVLVIPPEAPADWVSAALLKTLTAIPGVAVHQDVAGAEARRFGAEASGAVAVYDAHGRLAFSGGITGSRGHIGDNDGRGAVLALAAGQPAQLKQTPVFGCSLVTPPAGRPSE